jgi:hypothetical protein
VSAARSIVISLSKRVQGPQQMGFAAYIGRIRRHVMIFSQNDK